MAKTKVSSTDLIWMFHERLSEFKDHPVNGIAIAIVPESKGTWRALTPRQIDRRQRVLLKRVSKIEKQLQEQYVLAAE